MTPDDAALLRLLAGAHFAPDARLILPSGETLTADEANAFTAAYMPDDGLPDRRPPKHLADTPITLGLADYLRDRATIERLNVALKASQNHARELWYVALYFAALVVILLVVLMWLAFTYPHPA